MFRTFLSAALRVFRPCSIFTLQQLDAAALHHAARCLTLSYFWEYNDARNDGRKSIFLLFIVLMIHRVDIAKSVRPYVCLSVRLKA